MFQSNKMCNLDQYVHHHHILSLPLYFGNPSTKSIVMCSHAWLGMGIDCKSPAGDRVDVFCLWRTPQYIASHTILFAFSCLPNTIWMQFNHRSCVHRHGHQLKNHDILLRWLQWKRKFRVTDNEPCIVTTHSLFANPLVPPLPQWLLEEYLVRYASKAF